MPKKEAAMSEPLTDPAELRRAVRHFLYQRQGTARSAESIARALRPEHGCHAAEVQNALHMLTDLEQVLAEADPLGGQPYYRIAARGVLAKERDPLG